MCALSGESYHLHRKTLVVNYPTIGAVPCILTRNATGLFHGHGPNAASYLSRVSSRVRRFSSENTTDRPFPYLNSLFPSASVSKRVLVQNISYVNDLDLRENEPVMKLNRESVGHKFIFCKTVVSHLVLTRFIF